MEKVKVYLNEGRAGFVVCQKCGKSKEVNFTNRETPRSGLVKCGCGNTFGVLFEKRQHYRRQLNVYGKCFATEDSTEGYHVKIVDISRGGIQFLKTDGEPPQLNETIRVIFPLRGETINCVVSVCNIHDEHIGGKFISIDQHSKKVLGFFLLS